MMLPIVDEVELVNDHASRALMEWHDIGITT